jgi:integrase
MKTRRRQGKNAGGPLSARTVRYVHTILSKALSDAQTKNLVACNVAHAATPPAASAARAPEFDIWTPEQLRTFLASVKDHHHGAMFGVFGMTGVRRSEACGLRWRDTDLEAGIITIRQRVALIGTEARVGPVKSRRSRRTIDRNPTTTKALKAHRTTQLGHRALIGTGYTDSDLVFAMPDGHPWNPESISQAFERAEARADLPRIRLHDLRHSHATHLLAAGANPKVVSERLGHASVTFTTRDERTGVIGARPMPSIPM